MNGEEFDEWSKSAWVVINNWKMFCKQLREEIARLNAENSALYADANRYRYLRDRGFQFATVELGTDCDGDGFVELKTCFRIPEIPNHPYDEEEWTATQIDEAIDNALKETK